LCKREWYVSETKDSLSGLVAGGGLPYGYAGHASECVYSNDYSFSFPSELARWSVMFIQGFVRPVAVPLFLMASAYLLVPVRTDTRTFLNKRFTRVGIPFVVFLFLYAFLPAAWGEFSWAEAWTNVKLAGINFIPRESHLWFVYMIF
jgi:surface polysaccharide O-acyltransferase-like enzyme